ncbi:hypothetical protein PFICI_06737 [Pestalotiopsis fici W106-1]|uniref:TauD/TfdA-like domain-containing protein n=1 Tax=Pestalotiopsis fici (strain W106-1 / CGMCC3.15140) TaxID=1229662 RepID=W3X6R8_PESFW|nr:uncharacterized protein PFICI_06737 [Pestalotiopsis fici W106-1]ETS81735.1 hypothetical protein PFICI_06737 [Pestalotiopsis fici W106-1]
MSSIGDATTTTPEANSAKPLRSPLQLRGVLDNFESFDVTPVIGREFPNASLKEWLEAPNSDELLRDLAITVSQRGVVFFRRQNDLTSDLQKELVDRMGKLSGKPATSGLHIHPVNNASRKMGGDDDHISTISYEQRKMYGRTLYKTKQSAKEGWHSDITFEPCPSDYAILRLTQLPRTGGDTLWASGYEVYDRISKPYQKFLEGLTATSTQPLFKETAAKNDFAIHPGPRGSLENVGTSLTTVHPVVRTNPVTGWKSIFAVGHHMQRINDVSDAESQHLLQWFVRLIVDNHDLQVRHRWQNPNDVAIWDNRSTFHTATFDYEGLGSRSGQRAVSVGERPYFDPSSVGRQEALAQDIEKSG